MILTLVGGGAHRLLGTVRSALQENVFAGGGEIRLYDLAKRRAQAMAAMIKKSPEYARTPVTVKWDLTLEEALDGADLVSVTLLAGGARPLAVESSIAASHGFVGSDNISYPGAFLALRGLPIILNIARAMEKYCPNAVLLDFANPVAVLTAAVRMTTKIQCYGICAGHTNHGWDYNRILTGRDAYDPDYDLLVAGVNHMSWVVKGTIHGTDVVEALLRRERECPDWADRLAYTAEKTPEQKRYMTAGLHRIMDLIHNHGALLFSTEGDGFSHFYYEEKAAAQHACPRADWPELLPAAELARLEKSLAEQAEARRAEDAQFDAYAAMPAGDIPWNDPLNTLFYVFDGGDVTTQVLKGLAGVQDCTVAISDLNEGSVTNLDPALVLEYSHRVDKHGAHRIGGLQVPMGVYGMTASIAAHQTLLARAGAEEDPRLLYEALRAYPIGADTKSAHEMWRKLLISSKDFIAPAFQSMPDYYEI